MPFIGQEPITGAYHVLDAITASATATYNLQLNSGAFSPATANQLLVSLNGVIQKPGSSFTISGSQITFSSALTSSDSIDFIIALGDVLNVGTPTDGTVSTAKIITGAVTDAKIADMAATKLTGTVSNARFPVGCVVQTLQSRFNPSHESTSSTSYQASAMHMTIEKHFATSKVLVTMAQGHQYVNAYANGTLSTICQEGSSSTLTASTSYNSSNDPTTAVNFGMQQVYNSTTLNTAPHSKNYLFDSTGSKFEAFRNFYRSRTAGRNAQFHESGHQLTMTLMEIKQ